MFYVPQEVRSILKGLLVADKVDVYSSDDNHCQGRTPALVRILMFPYFRIVSMLLIVVLGLIINTKNCLCCSECT